jgi:hypothetical protein
MATDLLSRVVHLANPRHFSLEPIDLTRLSGAKMKGFSLIQLFDTVAAEHGPAVLERWRATVPEALRGVVDRRAVTSVGWLNIEFYYHLVGYVVEHELQGDPRRAVELGARVASKEIGAFFRAVLGFTTPGMVISLSGRFWRSYYDRSQLKLVESKAGSVKAEVHDWPMHDEISIHELLGSLIQWIEASRSGDVQITAFELLAPGSLRIEAKW